MTKINKSLIASAIATVLGTSTVYAAPSFEQRDISNVGWLVVYEGKNYDANSNTTTFNYSLSVTAAEKDLSHWVLGYDGDMLPNFGASCSQESNGLDPTTGVSGLKCDDGQAKGTVKHYTVIVPGNACEETVNYAVKGGTYYAVAPITGPGEECASPVALTYSISGTAYIDADLNNALGEDEPRLANVTVILYDLQDNEVLRMLTDANGYYEFDNLQVGNYVVKIPALTQAVTDDVNEQLNEYFDGTVLNNSLPIALNANSANNDFGFMVDTTAILNDLNPSDPDGDSYTMAGTGKTIGFWKHQNTVAIKGKGRAQVDAATLQGYLDAIEGAWLVGVDKPFEFNDANEYQAAFNIMSNTSSNEVDLLEKQLLGTELNHMAGGGLSGAMYALQGNLINWAEYIVAYSGSFTREEILIAKDICDYINNTGE